MLHANVHRHKDKYVLQNNKQLWLLHCIYKYLTLFRNERVDSNLTDKSNVIVFPLNGFYVYEHFCSYCVNTSQLIVLKYGNVA